MSFVTGRIRFAYVFYESGLSINVMYGLEEGTKRAVGFKLSEGMPVPDELASRFKPAKQRSKMAGTIPMMTTTTSGAARRGAGGRGRHATLSGFAVRTTH